MMSSGWDQYYMIFVSGAVACLLPFVITVNSLIIAWSRRDTSQRKIQTERKRDVSIGGTSSSANLSEKRINTRFFLAVNVATVLMGMAILLIPCTSSIELFIKRNDGGIQPALFAVFSISVLLALGLFYSGRKGDLSWLKTYQKRKEIK